MKSHKSEVAVTYLFICTPTRKQTVLEKTQANKTFRTRKEIQQLYKVVYLQVTIIHDGNCDKMINYQAHDLCV